ncbi:O-antigen ligase family protein [Tenacibaculum sp. FZY0031]|uniref:O-antigen ligase family protein n=1 Tax=Tenacibaculum sp. FZY0031 TaxID=3116648 RepID=UPI002EB5A09D|nr:O-antigen ligase family protein [Tenacibaculum sp. FZY0031]
MERLSLFDKLVNLYIIILIIGFLFIGTIPKLIGGSEESLSVQFRIVVLMLSLFFIISTIFSRRINKVYLAPFLFFIIFWFIYSLRLIHDLYIDPIKLYTDTPSSRYAQFAFGVTLVPSVALLIVIQAYKINISKILSRLYYILLIILSIALYFRAGADLQGRTTGDLNVGILLFGQFGATLSILSVYRFMKEKRNLKNNLLHFFGFIIGVSSIFVSASKSPFLALIVVVLLLLFLWYGSIKSVFLILIIGGVLGAYFVDIALFLNNYFKSNFLERLFYAIEVGGDNAREIIVSTAFNEFIDNPFFGNAFLIQNPKLVGSYPHNLVVESLMSTGILGGGVFIIWVIKSLRESFRVIRKHSDLTWVALLFLQYFIFGMFSKNLYSSDLFWFFSIILISAKQNRREP